MTIVDELKELASMVGVTATGSNIYDVIRSFKAGLIAKQQKEKKLAEKKEPAFSFDIPEEPAEKPKRTRKKAEKAEKPAKE